MFDDQQQSATAPVPTQSAGQGGQSSQLDPIMQTLQRMMNQKSVVRQQPLPQDPTQSKGGKAMRIAGDIGISALKTVVPMLGASVQHAVKQQREQQIVEIQNDLEVYQSELNNADIAADQATRQGQDPEQARKDYMQKSMQNGPLSMLMNGPRGKKFVKGMSKVFGTDLLDVEKQNTVYHEGFKRHLKKQQAKQQMEQAKSKMDNFKMSQEMLNKIPVNQGMGGGSGDQTKNMQMLEQLSKLQFEMNDKAKLRDIEKERADAAARDRYETKFDNNNRMVIVDKDKHTAKYVEIQDADGKTKPVTGQTKGKNGIAIVDRMPVGVFHNGEFISPDNPKWTDQDAKDFARAKSAQEASDKIVSDRMARSNAERVAAYMGTRFYNVMDSDGNMVMASAKQLSETPGKYAGASPAQKALNQQSTFKELNQAMTLLDQEILRLPDAKIDRATRAKLVQIMHDDNPSAMWRQFLSGESANSLTEAQQDYVTAIISMQESAIALSSMGGMRAASDKVRNAIARMVPSETTPDKRYAQRQMYLLKQEINQLSKGVAHIGNQKPGDAPKPITLQDILPK